MKIRFVPILLAALLLSVATSEARSRRHPHKPADVALGPDSDGGGPLARSRGLSQVESEAVGAVLAEIAGSPASAADAGAANVPNPRYSPDYYRVYSHRTQMAGAKQRVAIKPPEAKPQTVAATPPNAAKPAVVAKLPVAPKPTVPAKQPMVAAKRVAVAPAVKSPTIYLAAAATVKAPSAARQQVAVATPATGVRMAFAPRTAKAKTPPPAPQATVETPIRAVFRD
jgi:hypothetical protein